ncbi:MAG: HIG1 domain-containing protein [Hellea sp.]|nr:HIG1 domain-containing protein [Hellea sp.]
MLTILYILLGIAMAAVVFTLVMGGRAMTSRKDTDRSDSNKWMWRRVYAQGAAIFLLILVVMVKKNSG